MNFPWEHVLICKTQKCIGNHGDLRIHQSFRVEHSNGFYFSSIISGVSVVENVSKQVFVNTAVFMSKLLLSLLVTGL